MRTVIEQIKDRLPITEVLSSYITLVPAGTQYKAKCPFHNERTASFSISPERGVYYCFGCGAKGDIFDFVGAFEGLDFKGTLKVLADRAHVELKKDSVQTEKYDGLYDVHEAATVLYERTLQKNVAALEYLTKRGLTEKTMSEFRIGYAVPEWRVLAESFSPANLSFAEKAGLIKKTEKGYYDRFRSRIMFPLMDSSGRVIGFSGRLFPETVTSDAQPAPKYLNSPETELFHKSDFLYGFHAAKFAIKKNNFSILVEGQMDLLLSHQAGFKNTVATSGTAVSEESSLAAGSHLRALARLSPNIILAFDGDAAGQKAMTRAALVLLSLGMNPKVARLPEGKDPADMLANGETVEWHNILKESTPFIQYQTAMIMEKAPSPHVLAKELRTAVFPYLAKIISRIEQASSMEIISHESGIPLAHIAEDYAAYEKTLTATNPQEKKQAISPTLTTYERFVGVLQKLSEEDRVALEDALLQIGFHDERFTAPALLEDRREVLPALVDREYGNTTPEDLKKIAAELLKSLTILFYQEEQKKLSRLLAGAEKNNDEATIEKVLPALKEIHERLKT